VALVIVRAMRSSASAAVDVPRLVDNASRSLPTGRLDNPSGVAHTLHSHDNNKELFFFHGKRTRPAEELNTSMFRVRPPPKP
jgi:hypothetical protein